MPKKEDKFGLKALLQRLMEKSLQSLVSVISQQADHLVDIIKNISLIKRKIRKLMAEVVLLSAGLAVLGTGLGIYLAGKFPELADGVPQMLIGLSLMLAALLYAKFGK